MKQPEDYDIDHGAHVTTMERALEIAEEMGADHTHLEYDGDNVEPYAELDEDFVVETIDLWPGDIFALEDNIDGTISKVVHRAFSVKVSHPDYVSEEEPNGYTLCDLDEMCSIGDLWLAWLRGELIQITETKTYVRADTGEEIDV